MPIATSLFCYKCNASHGVALYDEGTGYCHKSGCYYNAEEVAHYYSQAEIGKFYKKYGKSKNPRNNMITGESRAIISRNLNAETTEFWHYEFGTYLNSETGEQETCHIANYYGEDKTLIGQKLKFKKNEKGKSNYTWLGEHVGDLYGKWLWMDKKYKFITITEGELDALSVSQSNGNKYPVVSLPDGAQSADKVIRKNLKWLEQNFDKVVLCFDNDEEGIKAANKVAPLFSPGKLAIAKLPLKDASEMLVANRTEELIRAIWNAKTYRPDGIITLKDFIDDLDEKVEWGLSYPWPELNKLTYGMRKQELVVIGAGSGVGKTEFMKEIIVHLRKEHNQKVGIIFLEENPKRTSLSLAGKFMNKPIHIPDVKFDPKEKRAALESLEGGDDSLVFYNHFGYMDWDNIKDVAKYMVLQMGCQWVFLDHITALAQGDDNGDTVKVLDRIMQEAASSLRMYDYGMVAVSHLSKPSQGRKPHEEGGRVFLQDLRGSQGIKQWASFVFGLERDQQGEEKNKVTVRCLKDRETGQGVGKTVELQYHPLTGRLLEYTGFMEEEADVPGYNLEDEGEAAITGEIL